MRIKRWRAVCWSLTFVGLLLLVTVFLSALLRPVRTNYGAVWKAYLAEPRDSLDYLWMGSSYAYCDVNPALVYDQSGLTGYVVAGPELTLSQSYWYLREALKTQSPSAVYLEVTALQFQTYQGYTQINVGYLPAGYNKLGAIFTASEPELREGLLCDLIFYHDRWKELTWEEAMEALSPPETDPGKGYTCVEGSDGTRGDSPYFRTAVDREVYGENLVWLDRMARLCREKDISFTAVLHPTWSRITEEKREEMAADLAELSIPFLDWTEAEGEMGLQPDRHYYDAGHFNRDGAAVFSRWLGEFLTRTEELTPRPQTGENRNSWEAAAAFWRS
ncbi:hypothetical protein H7U37_06505 [Pseudoflavonifractor phocaeensis]|uniref:hypothetical protein n=1 Tax=Pseudoflavonifractor phocaeensis TaxID=1870988 RepID=UPI001957AC4D|nr:hypothetical protein [Pseudoflavonifractor phocaeensis]MBM6938185.1 hypothetical protein [Pseudoflavonifractor phocaeensis]